MAGSAFTNLLPFAWQGMGLPYSRMELTLRHDLVQHKPVNRNGADIDDTGLAPLEIVVTIPFRNNLEPAASETWHQPLYPVAWRSFLAEAARNTLGTFQHPELGAIMARVESARMMWTPDATDGVDVELHVLESSELGEDASVLLAQPSDATAGLPAATDLDTLSASTPADIPTLPTMVAKPRGSTTIPAMPVYKTSFADVMRAAQAIGDQQTLLQNRAGSLLAEVDYRARNVLDGLRRVDNSLNWQATRTAHLIISAVAETKAALALSKRSLGFYKVPKDTTLAAVAATLKKPTRDVMGLNLGLLATPVVPRGSVVRYYADAA